MACASPAAIGGDPVSEGREPSGRSIASYRATHCVDAAGAELLHVTRVYLVEDASKAQLLVLSRPSVDSVVVRHHRAEGKERVYQLILDDGAGARVLHDVRLPSGSQGDGRMAVATRFTELPAPPGQVNARVVSLAFACRLEPERAPEVGG
jgi:hypothetical protein